VPLVPVGPAVRPLVHGATPPSAADVPRRAAELIATQFDKLAQAAEGCDALVASGLFPATAAALRMALTPQTRARATAVADTIRADGATVAATLLLDAVSREKPPVPA
jgi:hypothetical protein